VTIKGTYLKRGNESPRVRVSPMLVKPLPAALLLMTCAGLSASAAKRSVPWCHPADETSALTISSLQALATSSDPADGRLRDSLRINIRRASDVSLITTESTCQRGAAELDKLWQSGTTNRQVYMYKVGSDFGVEDPQAGSGHYRGVAFFSSKWVYKSLLLSP
jgi:hypothetical protein